MDTFVSASWASSFSRSRSSASSSQRRPCRNCRWRSAATRSVGRYIGLLGSLFSQAPQEGISELLRCQPLELFFKCHGFDLCRQPVANRPHHFDCVELLLCATQLARPLVVPESRELGSHAAGFEQSSSIPWRWFYVDLHGARIAEKSSMCPSTTRLRDSSFGSSDHSPRSAVPPRAIPSERGVM